MRVTISGAVLLVLSMAFPGAATRFQEAAALPARPVVLSDAEVERFLRDAKVIATRRIGKGTTGAIRATLSDGLLTHDAQIQVVEEKEPVLGTPGSLSTDLEDSWRFNVAAYKLDRLLGLDMVPVSISRMWRTQPAAYTWWLDDVLMDEGKRLLENASPPESGAWNEQMDLVRIFDQLIYNVDRNSGNLLIAKSWRVWAIDHTRAFRTHRTLRTPSSLRRSDRQLLARLKQLDRPLLKREIGRFISDSQIQGLLVRRDRIVELIESAGPAALFDRRVY